MGRWCGLFDYRVSFLALSSQKLDKKFYVDLLLCTRELLHSAVAVNMIFMNQIIDESLACLCNVMN